MFESSISSDFVSDGSRPSLRPIFSWSLPLALKFCEHFMSTSMVTLKRARSITRPASRLDDAVESVNGDYAFRDHWTGILQLSI